MAVINLVDRVQLREHPDLSPVADDTFVKKKSFIFPGDELVMITNVLGPDDFGGNFSGVSLQSVKMSMIAKKPNIFTEEFSEEFNATRSFELDSVTIPLNSSNAPFVPWGSDGYAPNINFTQDRNWKLPSGDFKRQIKAFTTHVSLSSEWDFNFWFPIIFREDYWNALIDADNDFYDTGEPQNGKNQKWLRYHDVSAPPFGWLIYYRFELFYTKFGVQNSLKTELLLSVDQDDIRDYESNPDYDVLDIKTCKVGGTPSNTPIVIFGDRNTSCFAYFTKQTAWDVGEKDSLTAVFRLRPQEGGDRLGSRGSSKFPVTSDVVWADVDAGFGTKITFSGAGDVDIQVEAQIDYNKLLLIFPGVKKFTLYCRLYNGTEL